LWQGKPERGCLRAVSVASDFISQAEEDSPDSKFAAPTGLRIQQPDNKKKNRKQVDPEIPIAVWAASNSELELTADLSTPSNVGSNPSCTLGRTKRHCEVHRRRETVLDSRQIEPWNLDGYRHKHDPRKTRGLNEHQASGGDKRIECKGDPHQEKYAQVCLLRSYQTTSCGKYARKSSANCHQNKQEPRESFRHLSVSLARMRISRKLEVLRD
jgi:hypothetical protein